MNNTARTVTSKEIHAEKQSRMPGRGFDHDTVTDPDGTRWQIVDLFSCNGLAVATVKREINDETGTWFRHGVAVVYCGTFGYVTDSEPTRCIGIDGARAYVDRTPWNTGFVVYA